MATPEERQKVHQHVLGHFVKTGRAPHYTELAEALDVVPDKARQMIRETATENPFLFAWMTPDTDYIGSWAPFSNLPNQHLISVDGIQKWFGQWGLEALAVSHLFPAKEVTIDTRCLHSGDRIRVRMIDSNVLEVSPEEAIGYSCTSLDQWGQPSWAYTWARMNLFRSEESVRAWTDFETKTEKTIKPVREWAAMFQGASLFRQRLDDDFVEKVEAYADEALGALGEALSWGYDIIPFKIVLQVLKPVWIELNNSAVPNIQIDWHRTWIAPVSKQGPLFDPELPALSLNFEINHFR